MEGPRDSYNGGTRMDGLMAVLIVTYNINHREPCDECEYPPVWKVSHQVTSEGARTGYGCSEHIDTVLMRIAYKLPPGAEETPPAG